jgi:quercetin dioxygenase-like cupin family protein
MAAKNSIVRGKGEGEKLWFYGGGVHTWKVTAQETDGSLTVFEDALVRGKVTPLHHHPDHDEVVYVIEGEILIHRDGGDRRVGPGSLIVTPRGVTHAFLVLSETARLLVLDTPGAVGEGFYRSASVPLDASGEAGPVDFGRIAEAAKATGATVIVGPPPFARESS